MAGPQSIQEKVELTGPSLTKTMREIVQPAGRRGTWLRFLNDQMLAEVYWRLRSGQSALHIVKIAQKDWGLMRESENRSLIRAVRTFRKRMMGKVQVEALTGPKEQAEDAKWLMEKGKTKAAKLDGMGMLQWTIEVQAGRVQALQQRELDGIPLKFTDTAVRLLKELLVDYLGFQVKLGVLDHKPSSATINIKHQFDGIMRDILPDEDKATKMVDGMGSFLKRAINEAVPMKLLPDGSYKADGGNGDEEGGDDENAE